jgi:hypothetical protein
MEHEPWRRRHIGELVGATGKKLSLAHRGTSSGTGSSSSSFLGSIPCSSPPRPSAWKPQHRQVVNNNSGGWTLHTSWAHGRQLGTTTDHPPHRNSTPSVPSFSKNLTSSLWMMENLCLVAALAQRPAKGGKQWGRETRASETQRRAAARKGEQIRKTRLPIIDTSHDTFYFASISLSIALESARLRSDGWRPPPQPPAPRQKAHGRP